MAESASIEKLEKEKPLPPNTVCVALYDFTGNAPNDLPFNEGEQLVVMEPSKEMFWYIARNSRGETGSVPVTFLKPVRSDGPPPLPTKPGHLAKSLSQDTLPPSLPHKPSPSLPHKPFPSIPHKPPLSLPHKPPPSLPHKPPFLSSQSSPSPRAPIPEYLQIQDDISIPPAVPPRNPDTMISKSQTLPRFNLQHTPVQHTPPSSRNTNIPESIDRRPPMPLPPPVSSPTPKPSACIQVGKYPTIQAFRDRSGWFKPSPDIILSHKILVSPQVFRNMMCGVYYFQHKFQPTKQYVGSSLKLFLELVTLFERLYEKKEDKLNSLERELRFNSPDASEWNVSVWTCHADNLSLELSKLIIQQRALSPNGLNESLDFVSRMHFNSFCEWYTEYRLKNKGTTTFSSH